jgi:NTP pyrophosphatase (non-canonical NTP hydrolase)
MKEMQDKIKKFNSDREWGKVWELKDLLLNMNEEIGELWHIIKWIDEEKQKEMIAKNKEEVGNFIGDMSFLLLKIASICDVDAEEKSLKVLEEYEKRFPLEKTKGNHANVKAGGIDLKD